MPAVVFLFAVIAYGVNMQEGRVEVGDIVCFPARLHTVVRKFIVVFAVLAYCHPVGVLRDVNVKVLYRL